MTIEQIESIEIIDYNNDEILNYELENLRMENQFDLLFLDVQDGHFKQTGYTQLVYK